MTQFHFDPDSYLRMIRDEVPVYDELQDQVANALTGPVARILDLGAGTGSTTRAVLRRFPRATVVLVDESSQMLAVARASLPPDRIERVIVGDLLDELPDSDFGAVVSALAVHHLDAPRKRLLFTRLRKLVGAGSSFVMADLIVPEDPRDAVTPLSPGVDRPDRLRDLLNWLAEAEFDATCIWAWKDLVVILAT
jgi:tRNA (cmo5U34)-methyltransferase